MSQSLLDPRLLADSVAVASLDLCQVRLAKNAAWPWVILVPQVADVVEVTDLSSSDYAQLWDEVRIVSRALQAVVAKPDKMNIAAIGNIVRQLHVHVVARYDGDPAWPGPVWGSGHQATRDESTQTALIAALRQQLDVR